MAISVPALPHVQPGDLITADFINELIDELNGLETRVAALETVGSPPGSSSGAISITTVTPQPVDVGADLTIVGANFGFLFGDYSYTFNGVPTPAIRPGSNDTVLTCQVPTLTGLPPGGGPVLLSMSNASTTATRQITVVPAVQQQQGTVDIVFDGVSPDPITAGADNDFQFHLHSRALLPATISLLATVTPTGGGWPAAQLLDAAKSPLTSHQLSVGPGELKTFYVRVSIPAATNGTAFTVSVSGTDTGINASSGSLAFTVGQFGSPDTSFTIEPTGSSPVSALAGTTITASMSAVPVDVALDAEFTQTGTYQLSIAQVAGTSNWTTTISNPTSPFQLIVGAADFGSHGTASKTIHIRVKPSAGATDPGQVRLTVAKVGGTNSRSITFSLHPVA